MPLHAENIDTVSRKTFDRLDNWSKFDQLCFSMKSLTPTFLKHPQQLHASLNIVSIKIIKSENFHCESLFTSLSTLSSLLYDA